MARVRHRVVSLGEAPRKQEAPRDMSTRFLIALAALAAAAAGEPNESISQLSWNMLVFKNNGQIRYPMCGATLIQAKYFVTAADCVTAPAGKDQREYIATLDVAIGKRSHMWETVEPGQQTRKIKNLHFQNSDHAGVVLGELDQEVVLGSGVEPACVDWDHKLTPLEEGDKAMMPSWGSDKPADAPGEPSLLQISRNMQYLSPETCKARVTPAQRPLAEAADKFCVTNGMLRPGDAGFGMFTEGDGLLYLRGIVTPSSSGQAKPTDIEFFTNATVFVDWMASLISPLTKQPCGSVTPNL